MARKAAKKAAKETAKKKVPKKAAKPAKARRQRMSTNQINQEDKALFLQHLPLIAAGKSKYEKAHSDYRKLLKTAKSDGFVKDDFDTAFALQREGGEKLRKSKIARDLTIARYLGIKLGENLDLFLDQDVEEQPPEQRAFDAGKQDALENKKADPEGFDEQNYLKGFHSVSEQRLKDMKKARDAAEAPKRPSPKASAAVKAAADRAADRAARKAAQGQEKSPEQEKAALQRSADEASFAPPASGVGMTRSQFAAQQAAGKAPEPEQKAAEPEASSMFQRKEPEEAA